FGFLCGHPARCAVAWHCRLLRPARGLTGKTGRIPEAPGGRPRLRKAWRLFRQAPPSAPR
ncbi:MAG: hypothetical protein ACPIOQ_57005, partial [Promethearchaeia archaeon]